MSKWQLSSFWNVIFDDFNFTENFANVIYYRTGGMKSTWKLVLSHTIGSISIFLCSESYHPNDISKKEE